MWFCIRFLARALLFFIIFFKHGTRRDLWPSTMNWRRVQEMEGGGYNQEKQKNKRSHSFSVHQSSYGLKTIYNYRNCVHIAYFLLIWQGKIPPSPLLPVQHKPIWYIILNPSPPEAETAWVRIRSFSVKIILHSIGCGVMHFWFFVYLFIRLKVPHYSLHIQLWFIHICVLVVIDGSLAIRLLFTI